MGDVLTAAAVAAQLGPTWISVQRALPLRNVPVLTTNHEGVAVRLFDGRMWRRPDTHQMPRARVTHWTPTSP